MKDKQINLYGLLEQLPTEQLDEMLQGELQKESIDENAVRVILRVLHKREAERPVEVDRSTENAWAAYLDKSSVVQHPKKKLNWMWRAAVVVVMLGAVLFFAPTMVYAERLQGMLTRWTDSIFEFFDPNDKDTNPVVYEFKTDNSGLQQVYDAAVEMGVTDPVVPMWLPEGFELVEIKVGKTSRKNSLCALFVNDQEHFVFELDTYEDLTTRTYQKDENEIDAYELEGVAHHIIKNNEFWTIIWTRGSTECFITIDCQEDILIKILESIYDRSV